MYDVITSLGYNCEISFRLENYFGSINAMPFSWSYVMERELFPKALEHLEELFAGNVKLMEDQMIRCENFHIKFHPRYDILRRDGLPTEETYTQAVEELRGRVQHLKDKFAKLLKSEDKTLFLMKVENKGEEDNIKYIQEMYQTLEKLYFSKNYTLAVIMEENAVTDNIRALETARLKIRSLKRFAPRKHTDIMGDVRGWKKLIEELTGVKSDAYYLRLYQKRYQWFIAVMKKYLHIGGRH